ncbi:MAG: 50S ribosomal protein L1 [Deltaproteobacteria bacterium]|nr:50S ribosomal protein L1 [Deltaproteobacteria bacterium]
MTKLSKRTKAAKALIVPEKKYTLTDAVALIKQTAKAKFDESVDLAVNLGVDPRKADQMIRGSVALPNGTGKTVRVLVLAKGAKVTEGSQAGADHAGGQELIDKIAEGWMEFDRVVATPDMMGAVGKIGKILGPRGLMPNPKVGTVTQDVGKAVAAIKAGQVEFRVDKAGILHVPVGRASFDPGKLEENISTLLETVRRMRPSSAKGTFMKSITVSATMGPGIRLDTTAFMS